MIRVPWLADLASWVVVWIWVAVTQLKQVVRPVLGICRCGSRGRKRLIHSLAGKDFVVDFIADLAGEPEKYGVGL
jgi:hypothetical protein